MFNRQKAGKLEILCRNIYNFLYFVRIGSKLPKYLNNSFIFPLFQKLVTDFSFLATYHFQNISVFQLLLQILWFMLFNYKYAINA